MITKNTYTVKHKATIQKSLSKGRKPLPAKGFRTETVRRKSPCCRHALTYSAYAFIVSFFEYLSFPRRLFENGTGSPQTSRRIGIHGPVHR